MYLLIVLGLITSLKGANSQDNVTNQKRQRIDGEFTSNLEAYEFVVPHKATCDGDFITFSLPNFFKHDYASKRRRREDCGPDVINYNLHFNGKSHHVQLWPNHGFLSPETIAEFHYPGSDMTVVARKLRKINPALCHYTGTIKGMDGSRAALSLCDGIAGYIKTNDRIYYIEPVKDFRANVDGHHLHVVYQPNEHKIRRKSVSGSGSSSLPFSLSEETLHTNCGTRESWRDGWKRAFDYHMKVERSAGPSGRKMTNNYHQHDGASRKISPDHQHRYLEVLVVADKKFLDFHKDKDHENYILAVMNMASDYFHDASTGSQLDVVVVRIIYLDENVSALDLSITPDAGNTLKSFCKWQNEINPKDPEHPQHHDIAVLITRHDICSEEDKNCGLLGLAYMASACVPSDACSINEDKGLILGVVIAHELGHIMGCQHDCANESGCPTDSTCPSKAYDAFNHIMAPYVTIATTLWSKCSRAYMRELLDNNLGNCLIDEPHASSYQFEEMLPGVIYDADYQCSLIFTNSTYCPVEPEIFCERLFCKVSSSKCLSNGQPPADGTKCSANKWCFKGKCIAMGERPNTIDGGWSKWSEYGQCSRTCGGGVKVSERTCNNPFPQNGGKYCQGDEKRFKVCNIKACPVGSSSFRAVQCAEFNKVPRNGKFHQWVPYFPNRPDGPGTCVLYCINEEHVYAKLSPRIKDGTPCRIGTMDMCLTGQCRKVGCDWIIDSNAVSDKCGVCNGDNLGCKHVTGYYSKGGQGYTKVVTLPRGARNILIRENISSENTIAIADEPGKFLLNGGNKEESDGEKPFGKNLGIYFHPEPDREELYIAGPLHQSLVLYIAFYQPKNSGFTYEYYIRDKNYKGSRSVGKKQHNRRTRGEKEDKNNTTTTESCNKQYHWDFVEWTKCSARCDGGQKEAKPVCAETDINGGVVNDDKCVDSEKPEARINVCNRQACRSKWHKGEWGVCSGCKHQPGFQSRHVWCATESPRWEETDILTSNDKCKEQDGPKPKCKQLCTSYCTPACSRYARNIGESSQMDGNDLDVNFFLEYYSQIDRISLKPENVILKVNKTYRKEQPGTRQERFRSDRKPGRAVVRQVEDEEVMTTTDWPPYLQPTVPTLTTDECHQTKPRPSFDPFINEISSTTARLHTRYPNVSSRLSPTPCPRVQLRSHKNRISVMFPVLPPTDFDGEGQVVISTRQARKPSNGADKDLDANVMESLKQNLLSISNGQEESASGPLDALNDEKTSLKTGRQWSHHQFLEGDDRPAAMFLVEHPNPRELRQLTGLKPSHPYQILRQSRDTDIKKPCHTVVQDNIPEKSLVVIEAPFKESNINYSDFTFEHMGDMTSGTLDLTHSKTLCGKAAVNVLKSDQNQTAENFSAEGLD